jgi:hypothetical protein
MASMLGLIGFCSTQVQAGLVEKIPTNWKILPATDAGKELDINSGEVVTLTKMVPEKSTELTSNVLRANDGAILAMKGEQLYARPARGAIAYCAKSSRKVINANIIGAPNSAATDPCFIDRDGDGKFDESFRIDTWNATLFGLAFVSKKSVPINLASYNEISSSYVMDTYYVGIKYIGTNLISGREQFSLAFGGRDLSTVVCCAVTPKEDDYPRTLDIMGAKYTITRNRKGSIHVIVNTAMPAGDFSVRGNI